MNPLPTGKSPPNVVSGTSPSPSTISPGAIAGIVIASVAVVALSAILAFLWYRHRHTRRAASHDANANLAFVRALRGEKDSLASDTVWPGDSKARVGASGWSPSAEEPAPAWDAITPLPSSGLGFSGVTQKI